MLYLIEILHQTTTEFEVADRELVLYLIEILHQTTTTQLGKRSPCCCILSKFYIKPQLDHPAACYCLCCILSKFYIKPQRTSSNFGETIVVSYRNSTSNHNAGPEGYEEMKVVSYRNSTSNHNAIDAPAGKNNVVSYRNSTSNHNYRYVCIPAPKVVSYRNSTSNHNSGVGVNATMSLYLIEILHQTTTLRRQRNNWFGCILSKFYIKPQRENRPAWRYGVVSYRNSTSNHNPRSTFPRLMRVVSYRNSTSNHNAASEGEQDLSVVSYRNSTSNHNRQGWQVRWNYVVSYRNSTSNHNNDAVSMTGVALYLIEILHQTTTMSAFLARASRLYLIEILHQTTTCT